MGWDGQSALRWNCERRGCHNIKGRPKLLAFNHCFPGRIGMSDIDGTVEIGGRFLFLEWKGLNAPLSVAQEIYHKKLTSLAPQHVLSVIVEGNPETMEVRGLRVIRAGKVGPFERCNRAALEARFRLWATWAQGIRKREAA